MKLPDANRQWCWQWVIPAFRKYRDPEFGLLFRHHLHETVLQRAVKDAAAAAGIPKRITRHPFRHSFATRLLPFHLISREILFPIRIPVSGNSSHFTRISRLSYADSQAV